MVLQYGSTKAAPLPPLGADCTENVGRCRALVLSSNRPRSAQGPATGDFVLLAYSGFVREPDLDLVPIDVLLARDLVHSGGPLFLKSSITPAACA